MAAPAGYTKAPIASDLGGSDRESWVAANAHVSFIAKVEAFSVPDGKATAESAVSSFLSAKSVTVLGRAGGY